MLSILVTYYNQQQYVSRSLDSIFAQNITEPFEVLVGDDGSQDDTVKIVKEYQERYPDIIKLFVMPRDLSVKYSAVERASANRLNLLQNCKGDYVCFFALGTISNAQSQQSDESKVIEAYKAENAKAVKAIQKLYK